MTTLGDRLSPPDVAHYPGSHLGLRWRSMLPKDGPAVYELKRQVEFHDKAIYRTSASQVADLMEASLNGKSTDTIVGLDADQQIVAVATVYVLTKADGIATAQVEAVIAPRWRDRGIGRSVLSWQDSRARQMLVEFFGAQNTCPAMICGMIDSHMTDRRRLYMAAGFNARTSFSIMSRQIYGSEQVPAVRSGYSIVPWNQIGQGKIHAIHMDVFTDHFWPHMRQIWWEEATATLKPSWSFVAMDPDGNVAGYICVERPVNTWMAQGKLLGYCSLLGVGRKHRGKGLSSALMESAASALAYAGMEYMGLDVDRNSPSHAAEIYERFGFMYTGQDEVYYSIDL